MPLSFLLFALLAGSLLPQLEVGGILHCHDLFQTQRTRSVEILATMYTIPTMPTSGMIGPRGTLNVRCAFSRRRRSTSIL